MQIMQWTTHKQLRTFWWKRSWHVTYYKITFLWRTITKKFSIRSFERVKKSMHNSFEWATFWIETNERASEKALQGKTRACVYEYEW